MFKFKSKTVQTVDSIVSNFSAMVEELNSLEAVKKQECSDLDEQIASLQKERLEAQSEAVKAKTVASKIQNLLQD
jgi:hypothetical protein